MYEVFHHKHRRHVSPFVSADKYGRLAINKAATHLLQPSGATHVNLLLDTANGRFAIKPVDSRAEHAFHLNYHGKYVFLYVPHFVSLLGVPKEHRPKRFPATWSEESAMLVATL